VRTIGAIDPGPTGRATDDSLPVEGVATAAGAGVAVVVVSDVSSGDATGCASGWPAAAVSAGVVDCPDAADAVSAKAPRAGFLPPRPISMTVITRTAATAAAIPAARAG
jgi:hypothetical protein